jgi:hypothetical protein
MSHADPIVRRLHACILAHVPAAIWGAPGGGKTARVLSYAKATDRAIERCLLSRFEPIDVKPRLAIDGQIKVLTMPEVQRLADAYLASKRLGVLFLDEFNRSTREVEGASLDIIDAAPAHVAVVIACNPPSRGQAARSLESAAANRFCHLDVASDSEAYANALINGWPSDGSSLDNPDASTLASETSKALALASAFVRRRPETLSKEPTDPVSAGRAWPSPRSWDHAIRLYAVARSLGYDVEDTMALVGGCVGMGPAVEFLAFVADAEIDPEVLLSNPSAWKVPVGRVDKTIAAFAMVFAAVSRDLTDARWRAAWALVTVASDASQADAAMFAAQQLVMLPKQAPSGVKLAPAHTVMPPRIAKLLAGAR